MKKYKGVEIKVYPYSGDKGRNWTKPSTKCNPSLADENEYDRQQQRFEHRRKFVN